MNRIRITGLTKEFRTPRRGLVQALGGVDLEVPPGAFFVLLGPSGCGKSTLLHIVAGIERPTAGEVWIGDRRVVSTAAGEFLPPQRRDVAMVFQSYALYPHMSVRGNLAFPLRMVRTPKREIARRVREAAKVLDIADLLEARPGELSGGQRQRVALGRAIVRRPAVLLLDEPLSNLDALLRTSMQGELKRIQRRLGVTTLYVTHDQTEALTLGDRVAVLQEGRLQQTGPPEEVYRRPATRFVAGFIGTPPMNLLAGRLAHRAQRPLPLPAGIDPRRVELGIRPEHLRPTDPADGFWPARLDLIASLGHERLLYLDLEGRPLLARTADVEGLREGMEVGLDFRPEHLHLFDRGDGRRVST